METDAWQWRRRNQCCHGVAATDVAMATTVATPLPFAMATMMAMATMAIVDNGNNCNGNKCLSANKLVFLLPHITSVAKHVIRIEHMTKFAKCQAAM